jgi:hypothetical protein
VHVQRSPARQTTGGEDAVQDEITRRISCSRAWQRLASAGRRRCERHCRPRAPVPDGEQAAPAGAAGASAVTIRRATKAYSYNWSGWAQTNADHTYVVNNGDAAVITTPSYLNSDSGGLVVADGSTVPPRP